MEMESQMELHFSEGILKADPVTGEPGLGERIRKQKDRQKASPPKATRRLLIVSSQRQAATIYVCRGEGWEFNKNRVRV